MSDDLKIKILVVDDEQSIRKLCMTIGGSLGFLCQEAESAESAATRLETDPPDLVLTDLKLPNLTGVELLKRIKALLPRTEVAIMTGHGSIESAVDAMKLGAYDYIEKPFRVEKMRLLLQRMAAGADFRGERHGKRTGGEGDSFSWSAGANALRGRGLRGAGADADGKRNVRLREGRIYRGDKDEGGTVSGGQRGNDFPG
jgi:DNA-binding NtrC family response regulator